VANGNNIILTPRALLAIFGCGMRFVTKRERPMGCQNRRTCTAPVRHSRFGCVTRHRDRTTGLEISQEAMFHCRRHHGHYRAGESAEPIAQSTVCVAV
jgi:hypothetical protein